VLISPARNPSIFQRRFPIRLWYPSQHLLRQNPLPRNQFGSRRGCPKDRHSTSCLQQRPRGSTAHRQDDVGRERDQFRRVFAKEFGIARSNDTRSARCGRRSNPIPAGPCRNAALRACSASSEPRFMSTPMRRIRSPCCARAASGHAAAPPPSSVMNVRRLIRSSRRRARAALRHSQTPWRS
jgi:hypothetical protein